MSRLQRGSAFGQWPRPQREELRKEFSLVEGRDPFRHAHATIVAETSGRMEGPPAHPSTDTSSLGSPAHAGSDLVSVCVSIMALRFAVLPHGDYAGKNLPPRRMGARKQNP